jgi:biopolymer transport protein ExbD
MRWIALLALLAAPLACERGGDDAHKEPGARAAPAPPPIGPDPRLLIEPKNRPDDLPPEPSHCPALSLAIGRDGIWVGDGTRNRFAATCPGGKPDLAAVTTELCARTAAGVTCDGAEIAAAAGTPYQSIIDLMDATLGAGAPDIGIVDPAQLSVKFPARAARSERLPAGCGQALARCGNATAGLPDPHPQPRSDLTGVPVLAVTATGALTLDGKKLAIDDLPRALRALPPPTSPAQKGTLILQADRTIDSKLIQRIMTATQSAGFSNVLFAIQRPTP